MLVSARFVFAGGQAALCARIQQQGQFANILAKALYPAWSWTHSNDFYAHQPTHLEATRDSNAGQTSKRYFNTFWSFSSQPMQKNGIMTHPMSTKVDTVEQDADDNQARSGAYLALGATQAALAGLCLFLPATVAKIFFPGAALPEGMQTQALVQLLGCVMATGAASCFALKHSSDVHQLNSPTAQRLQLGLIGFSAVSLATQLLYAPAITMTSMAGGAAVMGATSGVAYGSYTKAVGPIKQVFGRYFGAIPDFLRIRGGFYSGMYVLLTPTLALTGAAYLFAPGYTLASVFGFVKGVDAFFWWQSIGGGLMTIAPVVTYSLKKEADEDRLNMPLARTLNAGLFLASAGHIGVLAPMLLSGQGGYALGAVVLAWSTGASASLLGLFASTSSAEQPHKT